MVHRLPRGTLLQQLTQANPWWTRSSWVAQDPQLRAAARSPFVYQPSLLDDLDPPNLYTLRGPRRAGKSTLLKQTIRRLLEAGTDPRRVNFFAADALTSFTDLINLFQAARMLFPDLGSTPRYFFIDEITAIPDWQRGIKWLRDTTPVADDCLVVTGSSAGDIATGATFLAGRRGPAAHLDRLLLPMAFPTFARCAGVAVPEPPALPLAALYTAEGRAVCQEALVHLGALVDAFDTYLLVGGFPQAVADFRRTAQVSDGFARDLWEVIQSDLLALGVSRPEQGLRLLDRITASLTGQVALRGLAEDLGVTHPTAGAWVAALASAYLLLILHQSSGGVPDLRKQRKLYPIDPFLAHLPARRAGGAGSPAPSMLAEAALAVALFRSLQGLTTDQFDAPAHLFYHRGTGGAEVDFVVLPDRLAAESKYVDATGSRDGRALLAAFDGGLLLTHRAVDLQAGLTIVPAAIAAWVLVQGG